MSNDFVVPADDGAPVRPRVSPGAKNTELQGTTYGDEALEPRVAAPPVGGRAIAEAERFLAGLVGAASSEARVVRGLTAGNEIVFVGGMNVAGARGEILSRLT